MNSKNNTPSIKSLIKYILPDHVIAKYPKLITFAEIFFEYLDKENKSSYFQNSLYYQRDIRVQDEQFLKYIQSEIGLLSKNAFVADPKVFYDMLSDLWNAKGSAESIKTFFRIFLGDEVTLYYPWESVLIPSSGNWVVDPIIRVSFIDALTSEQEASLIGKTIKQDDTEGTAIILNVKKNLYDTSDNIYNLFLLSSSIIPKFVAQKEFYIVESPEIRGEVYKSVKQIVIENGGTGYKVGENVRLNAFQSHTFDGYVSAVGDQGNILKIDLLKFGLGNTPLYVIESVSPPDVYFKDFNVYDTSTNEKLNTIDSFPTVYSTNGSGAVLSIAYDSVVYYPGYYKGVKGRLSDSIVLQDSYFYQKYSYEITGNNSSVAWSDALKKTIHPAGTKVFSNVDYTNIDTVNAINDTIFVKAYVPPGYEIEESLRIESSVFGITQDYVYNNDTLLEFGTDLYFMEDYVGTLNFSESSQQSTTATDIVFIDGQIADEL